MCLVRVMQNEKIYDHNPATTLEWQTMSGENKMMGQCENDKWHFPH